MSWEDEQEGPESEAPECLMCHRLVPADDLKGGVCERCKTMFQTLMESTGAGFIEKTMQRIEKNEPARLTAIKPPPQFWQSPYFWITQGAATARAMAFLAALYFVIRAAVK